MGGGVSNDKLYNYHVENHSVETVFTNTNVYDDTLENYSEYGLYFRLLIQQ